MRNKILKRTATVIAAALLFGGLFLLFHDNVGVKIQKEKLKPYVPDFTFLELSENSNTEEKNTEKIPVEAEEKLKKQTQELCDNFDNSVGWINVPDTQINYPVMYSGDNEYYLHRAIDGSYLRVGSIFLDYRCNADFTRKINILYGHNMSDGSMFADVIKYLHESYFDSHNTAWLTAENAVYKVDFFSLSQPENYDDFYDVSADVSVWLDDLRANSFIWRNVGVSEEDKFISLSTCTGSEGTSRTVLTGKLAKI